MSGLVAAAIAGWFYVRNHLLYGDFTGTQVMALIAGPRERLPTASELLGEFEGFSQSFIGLFGAVNIPIAGVIYALFNALLVFAGLGLLSLVSAWRKSWRGWVGMLKAPTTLPAGMLAAVFLVAALALARWTSLTSASQGRLLFPAIGAISSLVAAGALALAGRIHAHLPARVAAALAVGLAAVTLISPFAYILPAYALPARFATEQALPPDLGRTELRYGDAGGPLLRWIGYTASPSRVKDGDMVVLDLYWQGLRPIDLNYSVAVKLFGRDNALVANADITPGRGMWQTSRWAPGEIVVERVELPARATERFGAGSAPTELKLDVTWYQYDPETQAQTILKTYDGAGRETGRQRYGVAGYASAPPVSAPVSGQRLSDVRVSDATQIAQTAGVLTVETRWYVTRDLTQDLTVFMHVFNARGEKVTQADGAPAGGDFPTRWWRAGDVIVDRRDLAIPGGFAPGIYTLKYGLYTPSGDFARMPAFDAAGAPLPDAALTSEIVLR